MIINLNLNVFNTEEQNQQELKTLKNFLDNLGVSSFIRTSDNDPSPEVEFLFNVGYTDNGIVPGDIVMHIKSILWPKLMKVIYPITDIYSKHIISNFLKNSGGRFIFRVMNNYLAEDEQNYIKFNTEYFKNFNIDNLREQIALYKSEDGHKFNNIMEFNTQFLFNHERLKNTDNAFFLIFLRDPYDFAGYLNYFNGPDVIIPEGLKFSKLSSIEDIGTFINSIFELYYEFANSDAEHFVLKYSDLEDLTVMEYFRERLRIPSFVPVGFSTYDPLKDMLSERCKLTDEQKQILKSKFELKKDIYSFFNYTI